MTSTTADPERQAAISKWDNACIFANGPDKWPQRPFAAASENGAHSIRKVGPAALVKVVEGQACTSSVATGKTAP